MNELTRMAYLDAMGIDSYISRAQLPGAAPSRRLVLVPREAQRETVDNDTAVAAAPAPALKKQRSPAHFPDMQAPGPRPTPNATPNATPAETAAPARNVAQPRFSVAAIIAGGWVWLEELRDMPLAREQVQLVQAMARALQSVAPGDPESAGASAEVPTQIAQFDWPMHSNQQLDQSADAASAALASFVRRKAEQAQCRGVVLLGQACTDRVPGQELDCPWAAVSHGTADMLANSALKRQVWSELKELVPGQ
jgi:hypothetical protein